MNDIEFAELKSKLNNDYEEEDISKRENAKKDRMVITSLQMYGDCRMKVIETEPIHPHPKPCEVLGCGLLGY